MIEIRTENGKTDITLEGTLSTIMADLSCAIHSIYRTLKEDDEDIAECFKSICKDHVMDIVFNSDDDDKHDKHESCGCECKKCKKEKEEDSNSSDKEELTNALFELIMKQIMR